MNQHIRGNRCYKQYITLKGDGLSYRNTSTLMANAVFRNTEKLFVPKTIFLMGSIYRLILIMGG